MTSRRRATPPITKTGLQLIQHILGLATESNSSGLEDALEDAVIIAIDFENINNIKEDLSLNLDCQAGFAILDTRSLHSPRSAISTHNFATGSSRYCARASKKFLFGRSITTSQKEILENIKSLFPPSRKFVLVGHDIRHDLRALTALGADFQDPIIGVLDTSWITHEVLPFFALSLGELLTELECPFDKLHCAGNDAHFTLRALLLLVVKDCSKRADTENRGMVDTLERIAFNPIPFRADPEVAATKKKAKRLAKSRKHQSRLWDAEAQAQIRAERVAKRLANDSQKLV